jgi:hypothetical protein
MTEMLLFIVGAEVIIGALFVLGYLFPNSFVRRLADRLGDKLAAGIAFVIVAAPFVLLLLGWIFLGGRTYP